MIAVPGALLALLAILALLGAVTAVEIVRQGVHLWRSQRKWRSRWKAGNE